MRGLRSARRTRRMRGGAPNIELLQAAETGDLPRVEELLQEGADIDILQKSKTPLIAAIRKGHNAVANKLIDAGANINFGIGLNATTPLISASEFNHPELVQRLLELGADPNGSNANNRQPIFFAAQDGHTEVLKLLLAAGADVNHGLAIAVSEGHEEVVRVLLEAGADPNLKHNANSIILYAAHQNHVSIVKLLLEHPGYRMDTSTRRDSRLFKNPEIRELLQQYIANHSEDEYTYLVMYDETHIKNRIIASTNPNVQKWLSYIKIRGDSELADRYERDMTKCRETISPYFFSRMINDQNNFVLMLENKEGLLKGLVIFKYVLPDKDLNDYIKIELLCGSDVPGIGSLLMQEVYLLAKNLNIKYLQLESITDALPFYVKKGFECSDDGCLMEKRVEGGFRKTRRLNQNARKTK
jgi:ankyrin repeat protein